MMGEWKVEDIPLPALFEQAQHIHSMAQDSTVDRDTLKKACEALQRCEEMISKLGLFSANESKEDISTTNLKYLLVPFYMGELTEKLAHTDRIQALRVTQERLKEFISFCETLELVPAEEIEAPIQRGLDPAARRARKIARFKHQKAAESKLQEIKERKERRGRSSKAAALTTPVEFGEEDEPDDDGEEEREAWLTTISLAICKALGLLEMLKEEEEMLSAIKEKQSQEGHNEISEAILDERTKRAETWHRKAVMQAQFSKPAQPITCAAFAQDVLEGRAKASQVHEHEHQPMIFGPASVVGGNLTTERENGGPGVPASSQVNIPRMPTISIEEAGLREMEMMNTWQERNAKIVEEANSSWHKDNRIPATNDDDDDEAAEEKARAWDDWKDENPRGAGNKKLTPCG